MEEIEIILEKESDGEVNIDLIDEGVIIYPHLENLEVTPSLEEQRFNHPNSYGYDEVVVNAISDEYSKPSGTLEIKVNGEYDVKQYEKANVEIGTTKKGFVINSYDEDGYPNDVSLIGMNEIPDSYFRNTFEKNTSLLGRVGANLHLPSELTSIGQYAFNNCTNLALTELPEGITSIGQYAFTGCQNLALSKLPEGITIIESSTFNNCKNLALSKLPEGIKIINQYGFGSCSSITLTELPVGLTLISSSAFSNCVNLAITELPEGITAISSNAFTYCAIRELNCKGNITDVNSQAFMSCKNLETLTFPNITAVPRLINKSAFQNTPIASGTGYIYVPDNLVDSFKSASNWSVYANQIKGVSEL